MVRPLTDYDNLYCNYGIVNFKNVVLFLTNIF